MQVPQQVDALAQSLRDLLDDEEPGVWCGATLGDRMDQHLALQDGARQEEEEEEVLDQRLSGSRQQIKRMLKAIETGESMDRLLGRCLDLASFPQSR